MDIRLIRPSRRNVVAFFYDWHAALISSNMADRKSSENGEYKINANDSWFFISVVILLSILVRCCVSLNPYSGILP